MSFIFENKVLWRKIILALFLLALLGPWIFDRIYMPAEYECKKPFVRLEGDFCGYPISGFQSFLWFILLFFNTVLELIKGTFTDQAREFLSALFLLPLVPFVSTSFLIQKKDSRRLQTINLIAWGVACAVVLMFFVLQIKDQVIYLWGLSFYIVLALCAFVIELLMLRSGSKMGGEIPPPV